MSDYSRDERVSGIGISSGCAVIVSGKKIAYRGCLMKPKTWFKFEKVQILRPLFFDHDAVVNRQNLHIEVYRDHSDKVKNEAAINKINQICWERIGNGDFHVRCDEIISIISESIEGKE